ncbi:ClC family H(+)/Cl(-) exchange transporter [Craterilacuibacter sp. RT1T]|uniref:ClC family H(+)/Cl(-) exchange transporter n=1 Tax=Craterilacuibacter sp. RT1T TaxID=2942211 RepID=UPI0020BFF8FF|nr:ClC family H(+)/Cl(-) exchange transporter [Craterilacuibacter sp. RT1T]MCL6263202.1 ClC family H(+)/Cl(-) exchange transporter [Craterilacuibacter sp. RT1T]
MMPSAHEVSSANNSDTLGGIVPLALLAIASGILIGLVGGSFRLGVMHVSQWMNAAYAALHALPGWSGFAGVLFLSLLLTALPLWLVLRFAPEAAGSGIQRVEAVWLGEIEPVKNHAFLPVKFFGGILALASGHALGREGPVVQMGSAIGAYIGRYLKLPPSDQRSLIAASAGAGLAVAFSAPLGGLLFTLEELTRSAAARLVIAGMITCAVGVPVAQYLIGMEPVFKMAQPAEPRLLSLPLYLLFGIAIGLLGFVYNRLILVTLTQMGRLAPWLRVLLSALVLALVVWYLPFVAGNGEALNQVVLDGTLGGSALLLLLVSRFLFGPFSYGIGLPGGLFAPLLALGAVAGALFGLAGDALLPTLGLSVPSCAVIGMAALFSASVRAPLTGIVLIIEMTGASTLTLPLLLACLPAAIVPFWLGDLPIYEALRQRMLQHNKPASHD